MAKKGLGRGLDASIFGNDTVDEDENSVLTVKITQVEPNINQPRKTFDKEKIDALAQSIREHGIIQPLVVVKKGDMYSIVAGERRWRAARAAELTEVPVIVRDYVPGELMEIALIENIQREDLNPIEEALGYKSLMEDFGLTQEAVSQKIGKSRSAVANTLRLLSLEDEIQQMIISGELSPGHARAVLSVEDSEKRIALAEKIVQTGMSVRQAEQAAKAQPVQEYEEETETEKSPFQIQLENITQGLATHLGTKVKISDSGKKGKIEIEYFGNEDLERLLLIFGYNFM